MEKQSKKILICEDHQIMIDGLLSLFKTQDSYMVIDTITTGDAVLPSIKKKHPDALLLDLNLPKKDGIAVLTEVKERFPKVKVIVLTMYNKESIVKKIISLKGDGFLLKNCSSEDLFEALDFVFEEKGFFFGKGVKNNTRVNDGFLKKISVTRREKEIILELIQGFNVPQIAEKLFISAHTVETHKKNIFKKLDIHNSIDLVKFVNENQLLP